MDFLRSTRPSGQDRGPDDAGQTLVEFALVMPMLVVLLMGLIEVALALNASLAVNRASQHGAHVAASAGNIAGADCLILEAIEGDLGVPNDVAAISEVLIERTAMAGNVVYGSQKWVRGGKTTCTYPDGTEVEVPYSLASDGYPEAQRCSVLSGCPTLTPARSTVDNVGVTVRYRHEWVTPLKGAIGMITPGGTGSVGTSDGWSFEQRNIFRMEPQL